MLLETFFVLKKSLQIFWNVFFTPKLKIVHEGKSSGFMLPINLLHKSGWFSLMYNFKLRNEGNSWKDLQRFFQTKKGFTKHKTLCTKIRNLIYFRNLKWFLFQVGVQTGFNVGYRNFAMRPPMFGITHFTGSYDDGYIQCEFKRPTDIRIEDDNIPANINRFQLLKDQYVVFLAEGTFRNGQVLKHRIKDASAEPLVRFLYFWREIQILDFLFIFLTILIINIFGAKFKFYIFNLFFWQFWFKIFLARNSNSTFLFLIFDNFYSF